MGIKGFLLSACLSLLALPAAASPSCGSQENRSAENLLRLHSELMVITVTCHSGSQGENLITAYTDFTKNNVSAIRKAELAMTSLLGSQDAMDRLRTKLANEFGQKIADMSAPEYCATYRDKVVAFHHASPGQVHDEVENMSGSVATISCH